MIKTLLIAVLVILGFFGIMQMFKDAKENRDLAPVINSPAMILESL